MKLVHWALLLFIIQILIGRHAAAQGNQVPAKDSSGKVSRVDTVQQRPGNGSSLPDVGSALKSRLVAPDPLKQFKALKGNADSRFSAAGKQLTEKLRVPAASPVRFDLTVSDGESYHPLTLQSPVVTSPRLINIFAVRGNISAWGVPLNVDVSTDRSSALMPGGGYNNLFKFDFDPKQLSGLLKSDLDSYRNLKSTAFGGMDLSGYTRQLLVAQLAAQRQSAQQQLGAATGQNPMITRYLNDPRALTQLLAMNEEEIRQQLKNEINGRAAQQLGTAGMSQGKLGQSVTGAAAEKINAEEQALTGLSRNPGIGAYLNRPESVGELRYLDPTQIAQRLKTEGKLPENTAKSSPKEMNALASFDLAGMLDRISVNKATAENDALSSLSRRVMVSVRQGEPADLGKAVKAQQLSLAAELSSMRLNTNSSGTVLPAQRLKFISAADMQSADSQINTVASTITGLKAELTSKGYNPQKLLLAEQFLGSGAGKSGLTEKDGSLLSAAPANGLQCVFSVLSALKAGSFGIHAPGGVQNQDIFMNGGHVTLKTGAIPLTVGYGTVNDINAAKDANYQGSVYNQSRNLSYISADLQRGGSGSVNVSVISSINREVSNSLYAIPSVAANNIAVTVSKTLKMGDLGTSVFDVSKSTTVYSNKFQPGSEAILDQKAGLKTGAGNDLFQAVSLGFTHELDIQKLNASDNFYFNYSGMGYQNPGNNGYGGAVMKYGGNLKKYFYNNKLTLNVRSDLSNIPISYTSADRWKTYLFQLDSRYIFGKYLNIALKYTANGTDKKVSGISTPVYSFQKIQFDGSSTYKIAGYYSISHFSIGEQAITNSYTAAGAANLLLVNYTQSVVIKQNSITANVFYNKELSAYKLIGNLLNTDIGYQYTLLKKLSMSSGGTYLSNTGIARQAGIRQSVSLLLSKHFNMDTYLDLRKNLITPLYPDLYASCRAEFSIKYHFSN